MEFISPHPGTVLIYDPVKNKVRIKPFESIRGVLTLSPDNDLVKSSAGHKANESDIGSFLAAVMKLQSNGTMCITGEEHLSGKKTVHVRVTGHGNFTVYGIHQYDLWLDKETYLPLKVVASDLRGEFTEEVFMDDLEVNIDLPDELFHF